MTLPHTLRTAAEGVLAGGCAGLILALGEAWLNGYRGAGLAFLAVLHASAFVTAAAFAGAALSLVAFLALRRGGRVVAAGVMLVGSGLAVALVALRPHWVFPPALTGSDWLLLRGRSIVALALLPLVLLLVRRCVGRETGRPPRRRAAALVLAALLLLALGDRVLLPALAAGRAAGHPSVVLISIDTLRADRLGAMGYPRPTTPVLDRLAGEGALLLQASAAAPWTMPSHASLFTSMLPYDHYGRWYRAPVLPERTLLAERFRDAGYRTAAYTGGTWLEANRGFGQGFEVYESHDELKEGGPAGYMARAARWVGELGGQPFFLFLHTYEVHVPYVHDELADPADAGRVGHRFTYEQLAALREGRMVLTERERRYVMDLYDGDVREADRCIGTFLEELEAVRPLDDVILVVVSDHGEDLWDHVAARSPDHGHSLYEELLHVPVLFRAPGRVRAGARLNEPVSLIDVAPTLLALAGLPPDPQHRGVDLSTALRDGVEPPPHPIFAESVEYGPERFSMRSGSTKVIVAPLPDRMVTDVHLDVPLFEVFDLSDDPGERGAIEQPSPEAERMLEAVYRRAAIKLGDFDEDLARLPDLPASVRDQLRALGYVH